jgi:hypothetical protein
VAAVGTYPRVIPFGSSWAVQLSIGKVICSSKAEADKLALQIERTWPDVAQNPQHSAS